MMCALRKRPFVVISFCNNFTLCLCKNTNTHMRARARPRLRHIQAPPFLAHCTRRPARHHISGDIRWGRHRRMWGGGLLLCT
uniref:Putative secreted protein n=1 Tax=Anopheles marajoara TaxID=58244 RepID=A0A2M4CBA9_9DIPT